MDDDAGTSCTPDKGCPELVEATCVDGRLLYHENDGWLDVGSCECWCHSDDVTTAHHRDPGQ